MSLHDPDTVALHKLAALRAAIREGLESGPAEPFDIETIIAEARTALPTTIIDAKHENRGRPLTDADINAHSKTGGKSPMVNPSKSS